MNGPLWSFPFDETLLGIAPVIIHCPDEVLAYDLMVILEYNGIRWDGEKPTSDSRWWRYREKTCYFVENRRLSHGSKDYVDRGSGKEYGGHIKCSFMDLKRHPVICHNVRIVSTEWILLHPGDVDNE